MSPEPAHSNDRPVEAEADRQATVPSQQQEDPQGPAQPAADAATPGTSTPAAGTPVSPGIAGAPEVDALLAAASAFTLTAAPVIQSPVAQQPAGPPVAPQQPLGVGQGVPLPLPGQGVQLPQPLAAAPAQAAEVAGVGQPAVAPPIVPGAVPAPAVKPVVPADQAPAAADAPAQPAVGLPGDKAVVGQPQPQPGSDAGSNAGSNAGREHAPQQAPVTVDAAPQAPANDGPQAQQPAAANAVPQAPAQVKADGPKPPVQPAPQAPVAPAAPPLAQSAEPPVAPYQPPAGMRLHQAVETVEAIVRMAQSSGVTRARVALHPEQLGGLEIHLRHTADGIAARVVADASQAAHLLRGGGEELRRSLEAQGLNLVSFDVDTAGAQDERRSGFGQGDPGSPSGRQDGGPLEGPDATETIEEKTVRLPNGVLVDVLA